MWVDRQVYFLSDRNGPVSLFRFDPATKAVTEAIKNDGPDIRSAAAGPGGIVYDRFGELFLYDTTSGQTHPISVDVSADLPDVRARISPADREIENAAISPTGLRAVFEAHGDIFTVPAKQSTTATSPARRESWSANRPGRPMGKASLTSPTSRASTHCTSAARQARARRRSSRWPATLPTISIPSLAGLKADCLYDNELGVWLLDTTTGKAEVIDKSVDNDRDYDAAWSPDSKWLAYTRSLPNRFHALFLYSVDSRKSKQVTDGMSDVRYPAFDRGGKYLYFTESTNYGTSTSGLDMSSDAFEVTRTLRPRAGRRYPVADCSPVEDEKNPEAKDKEKKDSGDEHADQDKEGPAKPDETGKEEKPAKPEKPKPVKIDLEHLEDRAVALPLHPADYEGLATGKEGFLYLLGTEGGERFGDNLLSLTRFEVKTKKSVKLADHLEGFDLSFDGSKMLLQLGHGGEEGPNGGAVPEFVIAPADAPVKPGEGKLNLSGMQVRIDPRAEWKQMFHEIWQIERNFFYDPHYHGLDIRQNRGQVQPLS